MMQFHFDQLAALVAVAEEHTFDAAARRLRVTASAVSQRIKAMELAAGQVLVRRSNPVTMTPAGEVVLRYARQVQLLDADAARELGVDAGFDSPGGSGAGSDGVRLPPTVVSLAVNADSLATWFLEALARLPHLDRVAFDLHREDQEHTTALLRSGTVLAAVTSTAVAVQGCSVEPLGIMRYRAVCSPAFAAQWRPASPVDAHLDWLSDAPLVNFDRRDDLQLQFARRVLGHEPTGPRHFVPTSADFARAVVLGFGWGLLPEQQSSDALKNETLVELAPEHPVDIVLYWQRWNLRSPLLTSLTAAVQAGAAAALHPLPSRPARAPQ